MRPPLPLTRVENLANAVGEIPVLFEVLRNGGEVAGVLPPVGAEVVQPRRVGPPAGQEGRATRTAHGLLQGGERRGNRRF